MTTTVFAYKVWVCRAREVKVIVKYFNFKLESRLGENHPLDSNCESANIQKIYTIQSKRIFQK